MFKRIGIILLALGGFVFLANNLGTIGDAAKPVTRAIFGGPTYDGSSEEAFEASVIRMALSLKPEEARFARAAFQQILKRLLEMPPRPEEAGLSYTERFFKRMDGKTHEEFMVEYYAIMAEYAEFRLARARDQLASLEDVAAAPEAIAQAKKDIEDFEFTRRRFRLKQSRAQQEL